MTNTVVFTVVLLGVVSSGQAKNLAPDASDAASLGRRIDAFDSRRAAQAAQKGLKIVVIAGEDAVNIIQQKTAVAPVVEVRDDNDLPVAGVLVRFRTNGKGAVFAGGVLQLTLTTNAAGRAAATGLQPLANGTHQIDISAEHQGQTATRTITQTNFATVAEATKAGRTVQPSQGGAASGTGAATGAAASGGGLSKLAIIGLVGAGVAGAAVAVSAATGDSAPPPVVTPPPPVVTNTPPTLSGVTASRSTALLGTEVAFSAQASDANNDPLTYAWTFGDGGTSTSATPTHTYAAAGTFTVQLAVSDGRQSVTQQITVVIKSLSGTFVADGIYFLTLPPAATRSIPARFVMTLTQSGTAVTGTVVFTLPPGERDPGTGTITGAVNRTMPTITLTGRFPQIPGFTQDDLILSLEPGPDVDTLTGNSARQTLVFRRQ